MRKSELKTGMIVQTEYDYWGVVEIENNQIDFCYRPFGDRESNDYQVVSLDDVYEFGDGKLGIGVIITKQMFERNSKTFGDDPFYGKTIGDLIITEEFVAVYGLQQIYYNGEGTFPPLKIEEN